MVKETENKLGVPIPAKVGEDKNCPFHGNLKVRGKRYTGTVIAAKAQKTALVGWDRKMFVKKYDRYEKRRTRIQAHNPPSINAKVGDKVVIAECRPLSKTKNFVIIQKMGEDFIYQQRIEGLEDSRTRHKKKEEENIMKAKEQKPEVEE